MYVGDHWGPVVTTLFTRYKLEFVITVIFIISFTVYKTVDTRKRVETNCSYYQSLCKQTI